jgi:hypothetical protein
MTFTVNRPFVDSYNDNTPLNDLVTVVPNDGADLPGGTCRALMFTSGGTVSVVMASGNTVSFAVAGAQTIIFYMRVVRVRATGTTVTAGGILAGY